MSSTDFAKFVEPARARPEIWRLLLGIALFVVVYVAFVVAVFGGLYLVTGPAETTGWMQRVSGAEGPAATLILLGTFAGMGLGAFAAARVLHGRGPSTLFGPRRRVLRDFLIAAAVVAVVLGLSLIYWRTSHAPQPGLDPGLWLRLLPLALLGVLIQTGAEELLFRGYLQQQLAARFRSPVIWALLPALAFGVVHFSPDSAGQNAWLVVIAATVFGIAAADLTAVTGNIGAAWGFHFINNCYALLVIATQGTLPGLALYLTPYTIDDPDLVRRLIFGDLVVLVLAWLAVRLAVRR
jgi:membrane protease YdiL (CAAX protease family)